MAAANPTISGIHHITAITADAQKNVDFYCGTLGLRLVKLTVNFDDPSSYHLYYGDEAGSPGTILTFFAWPEAYRGRVGPPQVTTTAFAVPAQALDYWAERFAANGVSVGKPTERFGDRVLTFADPDGMQLEMIASMENAGRPWTKGSVAGEHAIRGFHGATIAAEGYENTAKMLTETMGFKPAETDQNRFRYRAGAGNGFASTIDLLCAPDARRGSLGAGVVHHIAFRAANDQEQSAWREKIVSGGYNVSPIMDRTYFHSIYYREPGGVLFEIATDNPGFTADEAIEKLGTSLKLPPWMEGNRAEIERTVMPIKLPRV